MFTVHLILDYFVYICTRNPKRAQKTYCSIVSQSPRENEQTPIIGTATQTGAAFPYLGVACGEP
jgi:hypothetical protein